DQLYNGFKNFMSAADRQRPDLPKEPEVVYEEKPGASFTIVTRANIVQRLFRIRKTTKYSVTMLVSPGRIGKKALIRDKKLAVVDEKTLAARTILTLERGLYAVEIAGEPEPIGFEVTGSAGEVHV